jgi:hypothetical protein
VVCECVPDDKVFKLAARAEVGQLEKNVRGYVLQLNLCLLADFLAPVTVILKQSNESTLVGLRERPVVAAIQFALLDGAYSLLRPLRTVIRPPCTHRIRKKGIHTTADVLDANIDPVLDTRETDPISVLDRRRPMTIPQDAPADVTTHERQGRLESDLMLAGERLDGPIDGLDCADDGRVQLLLPCEGVDLLVRLQARLFLRASGGNVRHEVLPARDSIGGYVYIHRKRRKIKGRETGCSGGVRGTDGH